MNPEKSSSKKANLILGTYNSQSMGDSCEKKETAYQRAYKPFLTAAYNTPRLPLCLYYSGHLLQWMEKQHPEFHAVLGEMVNRKQIELLGGAFYEPLLPSLLSIDQVGQIELMTTYLRKHFGKRTRGFWLPHKVWDPGLLPSLRSAGMSYLFLEKSFLSSENLHQLMATEHQGKRLTIIPLDQTLAKQPPQESADLLVQLLKRRRGDEESRNLFVLMLDGSTLDSEKQERFFRLVEELEKNRDWLELVLPGTYVKSRNDAQSPLCYPPGTSLSQMEELNGRKPLPQYRRIGCRSILTHSLPSKRLYGKMIHVSTLVGHIRGDKYRKKVAREELWKAQTLSAYWGAETSEIARCHRTRSYQALLEAEKLSRLGKSFTPSFVSADLNLDGLEEFLYQGASYNAYVDPLSGGLFELDYLEARWNYLNSLHSDEGEASSLFLDRFFSPEEKPPPSHFPVDPPLYKKEASGLDSHCLSALIEMKGKAAETTTLEIKKKYQFNPSSIQLQYSLTNLSVPPLRIFFGCGGSLSLRETTQKHSSVHHPSETTSPLERGNEVKRILLEDLAHRVCLSVTTKPAANGELLPLNETSLETADHRDYQMALYWPLELGAGETLERTITLDLKATKKVSQSKKGKRAATVSQ